MKLFQNKILLALALSLLISGCSEDTATSKSANSAQDPDLTGDALFDSISTKFMDKLPGMPRIKTNCMVESMTEGGAASLDDINAMKLDMIGLGETPKLRDAYYAAMKKCQK